MTKYRVEVSGYVQGTRSAVYEIEAESEDEARENYSKGKLLFEEFLLDDDFSEVDEVLE